ncbi:MAG: MBL fold metallo-hydrolase [Deltaproteobacteria bacterium]|nr:MBL fold metallo-hydrolase [Deltaproteobacteria bacterium]
MKIIVLGCGTSTGVPVIGCHCGVCRMPDPKNRRTRASLLIQTSGRNILIDTSTDLRAQALASNIERIDFVLFTHPHADHIHGIDELRTFNMAQKEAIPCYGNGYTIKRIRRVFDYIFEEGIKENWRPNLTTAIIDSEVSLAGIKVTPIEILHGDTTILGYRIGKAAYLTDCSFIPDSSLEKLRGLGLLVIGALRYKPHPTHFSIDQAIELSSAVKPGRTVLTHLSHNLDYTADNAKLPKGVELAYDGMVIEV